jgi:hypothetical protein
LRFPMSTPNVKVPHAGAERAEQALLSRRRITSLIAGLSAASAAACTSGTNAALPPANAGGLAGSQGLPPVDSTGHLRTLVPEGPPTSTTVAVLVRSFRQLGDGGGGVFMWTDGADGVDDGAITISAAQGGRRGHWQRVYDGAVSARWFGARCDGMADGTAAIPRAIDHCCRSPRPTALRIPGRCRITRAINIDRKLGTVLGELRIFGEGEGAGFFVEGPTTIFDSTLSDEDGPKSEEVSFESLHFEASQAGHAARVLNAGRFLRIKFVNCHFEKIACGASSHYVQSYYFLGCKMRRWQGNFLAAGGSYDVNFDCCLAELGGTLFTSVGQAGTSGFRLTNSLLEGFNAEPIRIAQARGVTISSNYFEGNSGVDLNLWGNGGGNRGVHVSGNFFWQKDENRAIADHFSIVWGPTLGGFSAGNFCFGKLHDTKGNGAGALVVLSDVADGGELLSGHGRGLHDPCREHAVGTVIGVSEAALYASTNGKFIALDAATTGIAAGGRAPYAELHDGQMVPSRLTWGETNPAHSPATYGHVYWKRGSIVFDLAPAPGGFVGWICVASGSPGSWQRFGQIAPGDAAPRPRPRT